MKTFDLEKALAGEPVRLRDGTKAYVKYVMPEEYKGDYPLRGYMFDYTSPTSISERFWTMKGNGYDDLGSEDRTDIIGMWEEQRPRVQFDLPAPLKEPQEDMWYITDNGKAVKSNYREGFESLLDQDGFDTGHYFATKEDAEEWVNAMRGARR